MIALLAVGAQAAPASNKVTQPCNQKPKDNACTDGFFPITLAGIIARHPKYSDITHMRDVLIAPTDDGSAEICWPNNRDVVCLLNTDLSKNHERFVGLTDVHKYIASHS